MDGTIPLTTEVISQRGWDRENRLTYVNASAVGRDVTYAYDALGRRVSRNDGEESRFTYDGQDVLMDDDGTKYQNAPGIDNKLKQKKGSTTKYFLQDHLGSTVGLADSSGTVTESNSYDSFGNPTNSTFSSRYQFTGREFDNFTGLQYSRARWYHPQIGRFISEDPIGFAGGDVNLYGYVKNNPVNNTDPSGRFPVVLAIVAGAVAAELILHYALAEYADSVQFSDPDGFGRKRHCLVNCMSTRIHLGFAAPATILGSGKEAINYFSNGDGADAIGDMYANFGGQDKAIQISRGCKELCDECPY